ncbi:Serine/threonine-protein kinase pakC [Zancudomyces culisetae]|uniref:Serine/threonine-protein kinase pakC n=1 Tax=Zancudomyces culisetae TaxID=1213189 RepID=A0A1R1PRU6_ZANCU|nr:Serine/threonine-protein kinase pakC [Zancudomyces culisetae]OMH83698.1 Serine/threonine-protein kinase pakC [Zancudomyces culisetae]|eukprot:OMH83613.1 Serine/threonine-protein kinase pakC [Zancudomyces culisetae]
MDKKTTYRVIEQKDIQMQMIDLKIKDAKTLSPNVNQFDKKKHEKIQKSVGNTENLPTAKKKYQLLNSKTGKTAPIFTNQKPRFNRDRELEIGEPYDFKVESLDLESANERVAPISTTLTPIENGKRSKDTKKYGFTDFMTENAEERGGGKSAKQVLNIGSPYSIRHDLHIEVDQIEQILSALPNEYWNYVGKTKNKSTDDDVKDENLNVDGRFLVNDKILQKKNYTLEDIKSLRGLPTSNEINEDSFGERDGNKGIKDAANFQNQVEAQWRSSIYGRSVDDKKYKTSDLEMRGTRPFEEPDDENNHAYQAEVLYEGNKVYITGNSYEELATKLGAFNSGYLKDKMGDQMANSGKSDNEERCIEHGKQFLGKDQDNDYSLMNNIHSLKRIPVGITEKKNRHMSILNNEIIESRGFKRSISARGIKQLDIETAISSALNDPSPNSAQEYFERATPTESKKEIGAEKNSSDEQIVYSHNHAAGMSTIDNTPESAHIHFTVDIRQRKNTASRLNPNLKESDKPAEVSITPDEGYSWPENGSSKKVDMYEDQVAAFSTSNEDVVCLDGVDMGKSYQEKHLYPVISTQLQLDQSQYKNMVVFAEGESGDVYFAEDKKTGGRVAIKVIPYSSKNRIRGINNEIEILRESTSFNTVYFLGCLEKKGCVWLVNEYMDLGSLADVFERYPQSTLPPPVAAYCLNSLFLALNHLHSCSILHMDICSDNILFNNKGEVKLADFASAKRCSKNETVLRKEISSLYWAAPEVLRGSGYSQKSEIWAAGVVGYEILTGTPPYIEYPELKAKSLLTSFGLTPALKAFVSSRVAPPVSDPCSSRGQKTVDGLIKEPHLNATENSHTRDKSLLSQVVSENKELIFAGNKPRLPISSIGFLSENTSHTTTFESVSLTSPFSLDGSTYFYNQIKSPTLLDFVVDVCIYNENNRLSVSHILGVSWLFTAIITITTSIQLVIVIFSLIYFGDCKMFES